MLEIVLAFALDLLIGDPPYPWHPVRIIGGWIKQGEAWLRQKFPENLKLAGLVLAAGLPLAVLGGVWFLTELANQLSSLLYKVIAIYFLYSAFSIKDLAVEARRVYIALRNDELETARKNLSRIVGRDTENLNEGEIIRATVESIAESFVDGVVSPLFYAAIGGAPLAMAYKAVNTLDSMVGHRTSRYRELGYWPAKIDELANWVPARISWFLIGIGTFFVTGRIHEAWGVGLRESTHSRGNSVVPEAAFAGALGVELGGTNYYGGKAVKTPRLGYSERTLGRQDIRTASSLMMASSWAALAAALVLQFAVQLLFSHPS